LIMKNQRAGKGKKKTMGNKENNIGGGGKNIDKKGPLGEKRVGPGRIKTGFVHGQLEKGGGVSQIKGRV